MATHFADVRFDGLGTFSPSGTGIGYLRPDADDVDGGWTNELDGSVLFSSIDEAASANDSDYIKSSEDPVNDVCQVRLSNPSSLVTTPAKVRTRYKKSADSGALNLIVRLKQGATEIAEWQYSDISDTLTTSEESLTTPQFNSITDFNDLFLEFEATTSDPLQDLINGLTSDGIFAKLDRLWIFAQPTEGEALVDLVASATATAVNSPAFAANVGFTGDNATSYVNSNFNASTAGGNYARDSATLFLWCNTATGESNNGIAGLSTGDAFTYMDLRDGATSYFAINDSDWASFDFNASDTNCQAFYSMNRNGGTSSTAYKNGSSVQTSVNASAALPNSNFVFCFSTFLGFSPNQVCCAGFGGSLNATEQANLYTRLRTYMTAVGVP
jgi:hypothetical protein